MKRQFQTLVLSLFPFILFAQPQEGLGRYQQFFEKQSGLYQRWLDMSGLGNTLYVHQTEVQHDSLLILYLGFKSTDNDTVFSQWAQIREDFLSAKHGGTLEQELLYQMAYYMEIRPEQAQIRLFGNYDLDQPSCFRAKIYFSEDSTRFVQGSCKNEIRFVVINASDLSDIGKRISQSEFQKKYNKKNVFLKIAPYLRARYTQQRCDGRHPTFIQLNDGESLHFIVNDLCKEVLIDESNPWWCQALYGLGCEGCKNCIKRERLDIQIRFEPLEQGFRLITDINAAYGSGWYDKPRDNGYHDLQLDFPGELKRYADALNQELYQLLISRP